MNPSHLSQFEFDVYTLVRVDHVDVTFKNNIKNHLREEKVMLKIKKQHVINEDLDKRVPRIDAKTAQNIADTFLANEVGNLLMAGEPRLTQQDERYWLMPILLGNARSGLLGVVGTLRVDADTGKVLFEPKEKEKVKLNAKTLYRHTAPSTIP